MQLGHAAPSQTWGEESVRGEMDFWANFGPKKNGTDFDPKSSVNSHESLLRPASPAGQHNDRSGHDSTEPRGGGQWLQK